MSKLIIRTITIFSLLLLGGCQFIEDFLDEDAFNVSFNTGSPYTIDAIEVTDFSNLNFNETHIPLRDGYTFVGWYLDDAFVSEYIPNHAYATDLVLYANWQAVHFDVAILDTYTGDTTTHSLAYGETLDSIQINHEGLTLSGFKTVDTDELIDMDMMVTSHMSLYTVYDAKSGYVVISFNIDVEFFIPIQVILVDNEIQPPIIDAIENKVFVGWYMDAAFNEVFDFDQIVSSDMTLYAKIIDEVVTDYSIDEEVLSWSAHSDAKSYAIFYLNTEANLQLLDTTDVPMADLSSHAAWFGEGRMIKIFAVFHHDLQHELFDVTLKYDYIAPMYSQNFEDESFIARSNYSNNTNIREDGPLDYTYHILNGTASTTNPIEGSKSIQLRNNTNTPYLKTNFLLDDVAVVTFMARAYHHHLTLKLLNNLDQVIETHLFELTSDVQTYSITTHIDHPVKLLFELTQTSSVTTGEQIFIDNIQVYGHQTPKTLTEVMSDVEPDPDLEAIIARFATHRSRLAPPEFNALSQEGRIAYYASLNGLTGDDFKLELNQILTTTHQRLISYDEARFVLEQSDLVNIDGKSYLDGIYSGHEIIPYWDGGATWSREHVWPNSRLGIPRVGGSSKNQGTDVHNLRAINPSVNSSRSNRYFMAGDSYGLVGTEGYYPGDDYRGDVARILFYMLARYPDILTLRDDNIIDDAYTSEGAVMGLLSLLISWHDLDPVSPFEVHRNEVIYSYQGNRNPFIDNPEYVYAYFS